MEIHESFSEALEQPVFLKSTAMYTEHRAKPGVLIRPHPREHGVFS